MTYELMNTSDTRVCRNYIPFILALVSTLIGTWAHARADGKKPVPLNPAAEMERIMSVGLKKSQEFKNRAKEANDLLTKDPDDLAALIELARVAQEQGAYLESVVVATKAIKQSPDNLEALRVRAKSRNGLNWFDLALDDINSAIRIAPEDFNLLQQKINLLRNSKRFAEALEIADEQLIKQPNNAELHYARGRVLLDMKQQAEALAAFERSTEIDPWLSKPYYQRAYIYYRTEGATKAIAELDLAVAADPLYSSAYCRRGYYRMQSGDANGAVTDLSSALLTAHNGKNWAVAFFNLGCLYRDAKQTSRALQCFDDAIRADPDYRLAYLERARIAKQIGLSEKANRDEQIYQNLDSYDAAVKLAGVTNIHTPLPASSPFYAKMSRGGAEFVAEQLGIKNLPVVTHDERNPLSLGQIILIFSAVGGEEEPAMAAIASDVAVDCKTADGFTPLHLALERSPNFLIVKHLVDAGADAADKNPDGKTGWSLLSERLRREPALESVLLPNEQSAEAFSQAVDQCLAALIEHEMLNVKAALFLHHQVVKDQPSVPSSSNQKSDWTDAQLERIYGPITSENDIRTAEIMAATGAATSSADRGQRIIDANRQHLYFDATRPQSNAQLPQEGLRWLDTAYIIFQEADRKAEVLYGFGSPKQNELRARYNRILLGQEE